MTTLRLYDHDAAGTRLVAAGPYLANEFIKTIPGREWNAKAKLWLIPGTPETLIYIRDHKPPTMALEIADTTKTRFRTQVSALHAAREVREAGNATIDHRWVTQPYAHQRAGLAFLAHLGSGALLWEMGLGKTKTAIDYAEWLAANKRNEMLGDIRVLVIAPNTVARNWAAEIWQHAGHADHVLLTGMTMSRRLHLLGTARYSIVNTEALSTDAFRDAAASRAWDLVIVDESTRFKTHNSKRTKALHKIGKRAVHRVILTGTPITGSAGDAWGQFEFVQPGVFGTWYRFVDDFLELDWFKRPTGAAKPGRDDELTQRIGRRSYRVLKREVLDLPPKVYQQRTVELAGDQLAAYRQMRDELRVEIANMERVTVSNVLTVLLRLTQITSGLVGKGDAYTWIPDNAKVTELDVLLNDELRGEQVVIFGQYQRELEALAQRYMGPESQPAGRFPGGIIYGPTPEKVRHELIEQFQAGTRRLLFCQQRTGGIGITLTAAQTAVFYSRSWSLEEWLQAQDRLHRIGQTGTVSIVSLVAAKTVDEQISAALRDKQSMADVLTGDRLRKLVEAVLGGAIPQ